MKANNYTLTELSLAGIIINDYRNKRFKITRRFIDSLRKNFILVCYKDNKMDIRDTIRMAIILAITDCFDKSLSVEKIYEYTNFVGTAVKIFFKKEGIKI